VLDAVRFVVEKDRLHGQIQATSTDAAALPTGFVTLLMTDIEASTVLLRKLGDGYGALLNAEGASSGPRCPERTAARSTRAPTSSLPSSSARRPPRKRP